MTGTAIFFYFVLPLLIAAGGWAVVLLNDRAMDRQDKRHHPAE